MKRKKYLYHCTNSGEVLFGGNRPSYKRTKNGWIIRITDATGIYVGRNKRSDAE